MTQNELKYYSSLKLKKFRDIESKFIAEGMRLVEEGIKSTLSFEKIFFTKEFSLKNENFLKNISNSFQITTAEFRKLSDTKNSQGILGIFNKPKKYNIAKNYKNIVLLENISDPGNVGTILRTCAWFGIKDVILTEDCVEVYNSKVIRASMGAIFYLNIYESIKIRELVKQINLENTKTFYADMNGVDYRKVKFDGRNLIAFSNEAFGPSEELKNILNNPITIFGKGNIESLNVASASAIILSQLS